MLDDKELRPVLKNLPLIRVDGPWWRAVDEEQLQGAPPGAPLGGRAQPLWPGRSKLRGQRYTPRGARSFDSLYLGADSATVLAEIDSVTFAGSQISPGASHYPQLLFTVEGQVERVLDLTKAEVRAALGTTVRELKGAFWLAQKRFQTGRGPMPPTQRLGRAAYRSRRITAIRYPSRKRDGGVNLVVFTARLVSIP